MDECAGSELNIWGGSKPGPGGGLASRMWLRLGSSRQRTGRSRGSRGIAGAFLWDEQGSRKGGYLWGSEAGLPIHRWRHVVGSRFPAALV